jgi:type IV pilus assembly protein PilQ
MDDSGKSGVPGDGEIKIDRPKGAEQFPGYDRQPITVDFYRIDLHNVFRLFGEISGMNIVVAEGVSGSLTLSLKNVPWDFVLDLILNMKDLQKEERYNTLVISPKSKEFTWPQRARRQAAITVEEGAVPTETFKALTVKQQQELSPAQIEAGKLIAQGRSLEKEGEFEKALAGYEEAFELQPDNGNLAMRLASLSLVRLGLNAKALHYAKSALRLDDTNHEAALYAAISLANMNRTQAAKEYFDKAVSSDRPSSEALMNYAAFAEEQKMHVNALLLLARHEELYGDTLETMVARARIYDKEGNADKAVTEYRAILLSGFQLPPDLNRYIKGRLAAAQ